MSGLDKESWLQWIVQIEPKLDLLARPKSFHSTCPRFQVVSDVKQFIFNLHIYMTGVIGFLRTVKDKSHHPEQVESLLDAAMQVINRRDEHLVSAQGSITIALKKFDI